MRQFHFFVMSLFVLSISCRGPEGPVGPPGTPESESLTDPAIHPRVIDTFPPMNSTGPYNDYAFSNNQIQVRFNKIMDRILMKHAVSLSSPGSTVRIDTNLVSSVGGDVYLLSLHDSLNYYYFRWDVGRSYVLKIDSTAKDINGNFLTPSFSTSFTPEPNFRVKFVSPPDASTDVSIYTTPWIQFNSVIDTSIVSAIQISPPANGQWRYNYYYGDSTTIYYQPNVPLNLNESYSITINTTAHDRRGHYLPQAFHSTFRTASFHVTSTYPQDGATDISVSSSVEVNFTGPIDTGSVRRAFSIDPPTPGNLYIYPGNPSIYFTPTIGLLSATSYRVTLSTAMRSQSGDSLVQPYSFSFRTAPFSVTYTSPYNGQTDIPLLGSIGVSFTASIDTASVRRAFSVVPPTVGNFYFYAGSSSTFYFNPTLGLGPDTLYQVTLSTAMHSLRGDSLTQPYSFSFRTRPYSVTYTWPYNGSTGISRYPDIGFEVGFDVPIDTGSVQSSFSHPGMTGRYYYADGSRYFYFYPDTPLAANTTYTMTVQTSMRSRSGAYLKTPYAFSFTTGN
jgi:Big-like domain-containing protein